MLLGEFGSGDFSVNFCWNEKDEGNFSVKYRARSPAGIVRILKRFAKARKQIKTENKIFKKEALAKSYKPFSYKWLSIVAESISLFPAHAFKTFEANLSYNITNDNQKSLE